MQVRWHFSDTLIGKKVTVEAMPKVCIKAQTNSGF